MYADEMSLFAVVYNENDYKAFQDDLNNFCVCVLSGV